MKTIEGNKLIAEFMGVKPVDGFYNGWELHKAGLPFSYGAMGNGTSDPKFHASWDWLMPVVEKIETLELLPNDNWFNVTIGGSKYCTIHDSNGEIAEFMGDAPTKILCVWFAVIEFIEWYNKNK